MEKILLIATHIPQENEKYSYNLPPMGLLSIAAPLIKSGYEVILIDPALDPDYMDSIEAVITRDNVLFVGMTTFVGRNLVTARAISQFIKKKAEKVKVVWGGPFATSSPELCLKYSFVDYVMRGMGENSVVALAEQIKMNREYPDISNVCYCRHRDIIIRDNYFFDGHIDRFDFPALSLWQEGMNNIDFIPIISSRGCPRNCSFCYNNSFIGRKKWYGRNPENILDEMEHWKDFFNNDKFYFVDDNFLVKTERSIEVLTECFKRGYTIEGLNGNLSDWKPEILEIIDPNLVKTVGFAIESASLKMQKLLNKRVDIQKALQFFAFFSSINIKTIKTAFMFGLPTETDEDLLESIKLAERIHKINDKIRVLASIYTPQPQDDITARVIKSNYTIDFSLDLLSLSELCPIRENFLSSELRPWMGEDDIQFYLDFIRVWYYCFDHVVRENQDIDLDVDSILKRNKRVYKLFKGVLLR